MRSILTHVEKRLSKYSKHKTYSQKKKKKKKKKKPQNNKMEEAEAEFIWNRETIPKVLKIVSTRLPQRDLISLLLVSPWLYRTLISYPSLWQVIDLCEMGNAGNRLVAALSLPRYHHVKEIKLEFAQDIEDKHLELLKIKCLDSLQNLESLNLNGCQKISDKGIEAITSACPILKVFAIYWNVRITDMGMKHLVNNCKRVTNLNLSGCKNISDESLQLVAENYPKLESLNLTRCIKLTDHGLLQILLKCSFLQSLNVYALSGFTDEAYKRISLLSHLKFLDLCGAQNISDEGLSCIAKCTNLVSLNLTWCVRITDAGVIAIAQGCTSLEFLSLFGITGVTDKCLETLSRSCSNTITTLDANGCIGIKRRSRDELLHLFPYLKCFKVHS
ncbi:F-box protein At3g58530 [Corylus avellana]|uniref:F-box protein At3g58530 n=1 Tax=Corylus avellana TaxID=13451 RepID=UPI00286AC91D|nr:F-box protein At3g58530 [Corylus avellana]